MHNFKRITKAVICLCFAAAVILLLDFLLYPCTFVRNNVHTLTTQQKDVLIVGTSHGMSNIDPDSMLEGTDLTGQNLCVGSEYPIDAYYLTKLALEKQDPKTIIYEVDPAYFTTEKEVGNSFTLFYHEFPLSIAKIEYFFDAFSLCDVRFPMFSFHEYSLSTCLSRMKDTVYQKWNHNYDISYLKGTVQEYHEDGWIEKYPVAEEDFPSHSDTDFSAEDVSEDNMKYLGKLIDLCEQKGIQFIAVSTPMPDATLKSEPESFAASSEFFSEYFEEKNVAYYDFDTQYYDAFGHSIDEYVDYDGHMNGDSAIEYSKVLGSILGL